MASVRAEPIPPDRGYAGGDALDHAFGVAAPLLDLLPDRAFRAIRALDAEQACVADLPDT